VVLNTVLRKIGIIAILIGAGVVFLIFGGQATDAFVYTKPVDEVVGTSQFVSNRLLRVDGDLKPGSVQFREKPCEWRFFLTKAGKELPVRFPFCVVPDTFRDAQGIEVTVQGSLQSDGWFLANQLIPRCPSKYERAQRIQRGEKKPHEN
jgi:cytochrome c-type biogenesis protein CcmE